MEGFVRDPGAVPGALRERGLRPPAYDGRSIVNLASSVFRAGHGPARAERLLAPPLNAEFEVFSGGAKGPIVVVLMDGLGWTRFRAWRSRRGHRAAPEWARRARPLTSVFPSTTTAALVSLSSATPPASHGVVGHRQYLPAYRAVVDMLRMSPVGAARHDQLVNSAWSPGVVSGVPSLFRLGLRGTALTRDRFRGSGFTRVLYDAAEFVGYATASDLAFQLGRILARARPPPVVYVYWDELDTVLHLRGIDQVLVNLEIDRMIELLSVGARAVAPNVARRTTLVITGDHGQVPCTTRSDIRVDQEPGVARHLALPPAGDRRSAFLSARPGEIARLERGLAQRLPRGSLVLPMAVAQDAGLFGPPAYHPELSARLGDLLVLVPSPAGLTTSVQQSAPFPRFLLAAHGGLEPEELDVPLIAGSLDEFQEA